MAIFSSSRTKPKTKTRRRRSRRRKWNKQLEKTKKKITSTTTERQKRREMQNDNKSTMNFKRTDFEVRDGTASILPPLLDSFQPYWVANDPQHGVIEYGSYRGMFGKLTYAYADDAPECTATRTSTRCHTQKSGAARQPRAWARANGCHDARGSQRRQQPYLYLPCIDA